MSYSNKTPINLYNSKKRNLNMFKESIDTSLKNLKITNEISMETPINDNLFTNSIDIDINIQHKNNDLPNEISVGAILYNIQNSKVLLIQGLNKFYGFPKGHIEGNESEKETMIRELKEETNIDLSEYTHKIIDDKMVQSFYLEKKYKTDGPKKVNRVNIFYIVLINEDPNKLVLKKQQSEILKIGWFTLENAERYLINSNSNQLEYLSKAKSIIIDLINNKIME